MGKRTPNGTILVLALVMLIESLATGIPISYFPKYATSLGASVSSLGVFMSSFMASYAIMSPKMGGLSDRYGRKKLMTYGLTGDVVLGVAQGLAPNWVWLLLIRIINGVVASAAMVSGQALLMDVADSGKRGEVSGMVMSMSMFGHMVGPMFGGIIQSYSVKRGFSLITSYRIPYFVDSILATVALVLIIWKIPNKETESENHKVGNLHMGTHNEPMVKHGQVQNKLKINELSKPLKILLVFTFVNGLIEGVTMPLIVLFLGDKFQMVPYEIGTFLSVSGIVGLFATMYAGKLADRYGRKPFIVLGSLVSYVSSIFIPIVDTLSFVLGFTTLWSVADNTGSPSLLALRTDLTDENNRGRIFGYFGSISMLGMIIGPIIGTYLYGTYQNMNLFLLGVSVPGYGLPFILFGILGVVVVLMVQFLITEPESKSLDVKEVDEK